MANTLTGLIPTLYAALDIVSREMVGIIPAISVNAAPSGVAKGQTITIPVTPTAKTYDVVPGPQPDDNGDQDISNVAMTISKSKYSPVKWNGEEQMALNKDGNLYNAILAGQFAQSMRALVNEAENDIGSVYVDASRAFGTSGTTPFATNIDDTAQLRKILVDNGAPTSDLQLVVDTAAGANLRSLMNLTRANEAGTDATLRRGELLELHGFSIRESAGINRHLAGTITGSPAVNKAGGYGINAIKIAYDGATASSFKAGDIVVFGGDTSRYVINADGTVSPLTLNAPGLIHSVADDAPITMGQSYVASLAFDRSAIQAVFRTPAVPTGGDSADDRMALTDPVSGITFDVSLYRQYKQIKYEVGLAWGWKCIKPEHVAILLG